MRRTHIIANPGVPTNPLAPAEDVINSYRCPFDAVSPAKAETRGVERIGKFAEVSPKDRAVGTKIKITRDENRAGNASRNAVQFARLGLSVDDVFFKIGFAARHAVQEGK